MIDIDNYIEKTSLKYNLKRGCVNFDLHKELKICKDNGYLLLGSTLFYLHGLVNKAIPDVDVYAPNVYGQKVNGYDNVNNVRCLDELHDINNHTTLDGQPVIALKTAVLAAFKHKTFPILNWDDKEIHHTVRGLYLLELTNGLAKQNKANVLNWFKEEYTGDITDDLKHERYLNIIQYILNKV